MTIMLLLFATLHAFSFEKQVKGNFKAVNKKCCLLTAETKTTFSINHLNQ